MPNEHPIFFRGKRRALGQASYSIYSIGSTRRAGKRDRSLIVRGVAMNPVDQPHGSVRGFMLINRILVIISVGSKLLPD